MRYKLAPMKVNPLLSISTLGTGSHAAAHSREPEVTFRHYTNLDLMEKRLARLLETYSFQPFNKMLNTSGHDEAQLVQSI